MWSKRDGAKIRRTYHNLAEAKGWRADATSEVRRGQRRAPTGITLEEAATAWLEAAEAGEVLSRYRRPYAPSALRGYRRDLETYVLPELGRLRLGNVTADDFQQLADRLVGAGFSGSKVRNVIIPCQAIYRRHRRQVLTDPTDGLDLPEAGGRRKRVATPAEAALLIAAAPDEHRAVWATAAYAGLRRGELRAHRVRAIGESALSVEHSWDDVEGEKGPKSAAGIRQMPLPEVLRAILAVHVELTGRSGDELTFGRSDSQPFTPSHVRMRANRAWAAAGLDRIGLHELRHSYSTFLDAAGISETRSDRYMGHANPRWRTATATRSPDSLPRTRHGWTPISPARASGR